MCAEDEQIHPITLAAIRPDMEKQMSTIGLLVN